MAAMRRRVRFPLPGWIVAAPALVVAIPLVGLSFQSDERRRIYRSAHHYSANPLKSARSAVRNIDAFLDAGNFRPIGRFAEGLEHGLVLEAGEFTGVAPHAILGLVRLVMVFALALVCARAVTELARSAGVCPAHPTLMLYPLVLGVCLVANGTGVPLVQFPFMLIGAAVFTLGIALVTARDADMQARRLRWHEPVTMALLGAAAAMTYDLVLVAPALALAYVAARAAASGMPLGRVLPSAAMKRWAALSVGFLAVFVPVRIEIAQRCSLKTCYQGSDLSLSADVVELAAGRALTAAPVAGWSHNASLLERSDARFGFWDLLTGSLPALLLLAVLALTARAVSAASESATTDLPQTGPGTPDPRAWLRLGAALGWFGAAAALLAAVAASLSRWTQETRPAIGRGWRETLLAQAGWSLMILAVLVTALGVIRSPAGSRIAGRVAAALLGACLAMTLLANSRLSMVDQHEPVSAVTDQIAAETVNVDVTRAGNARRCELIERYTELVSPNLWIAGPGLRADLDDLMVGRHGWPFCDPARASDGDQ